MSSTKDLFLHSVHVCYAGMRDSDDIDQLLAHRTTLQPGTLTNLTCWSDIPLAEFRCAQTDCGRVFRRDDCVEIGVQKAVLDSHVRTVTALLCHNGKCLAKFMAQLRALDKKVNGNMNGAILRMNKKLPELESRACANCQRAAALRCAKCKIVRYCDTECQRADWPVHKKHCKLLAQVLDETGTLFRQEKNLKMSS